MGIEHLLFVFGHRATSNSLNGTLRSGDDTSPNIMALCETPTKNLAIEILIGHVQQDSQGSLVSLPEWQCDNVANLLTVPLV
jgi:hypothetical protein